MTPKQIFILVAFSILSIGAWGIVLTYVNPNKPEAAYQLPKHTEGLLWDVNIDREKKVLCVVGIRHVDFSFVSRTISTCSPINDTTDEKSLFEIASSTIQMHEKITEDNKKAKELEERIEAKLNNF